MQNRGTVKLKTKNRSTCIERKISLDKNINRQTFLFSVSKNILKSNLNILSLKDSNNFE